VGSRRALRPVLVVKIKVDWPSHVKLKVAPLAPGAEVAATEVAGAEAAGFAVAGGGLVGAGVADAGTAGVRGALQLDRNKVNALTRYSSRLAFIVTPPCATLARVNQKGRESPAFGLVC